MSKEYEVPVWFRISGNTPDEAWAKISQLMGELEAHDQLPPYVIEDPVAVGTPYNTIFHEEE